MTLKTCAAVAAMLLAPSVWAAGVPVLSASGSLGDLTYRLVDLNPNDGITAGVTFGTSTAGALSVDDSIANNAGNFAANIERQDVNVNGGPFSSGLSGTVALSDGRASVTSVKGAVSGTAGYDVAYLNAMAAGTPPGVFNSHYESVYVTLPQSLAFTLTPNTRIEFSAKVSLSAQADTAALKAYARNGLFTVQAIASATAYLSNGGQFGLPTDVNGANSFAQRSVAFNAAGVVSDTSSDPARAKDLFFYATNNTLVAQTGQLDLIYSNQIVATLSAQLQVPEASTWALYSLGLVGVAAAARRHRPTA